jgi:hypothetical protein
MPGSAVLFVSLPPHHPPPFPRFRPVMHEPQKRETSASLAAVIVRFGEVYQLRLFRVYGHPIFGNLKAKISENIPSKKRDKNIQKLTNFSYWQNLMIFYFRPAE